MPIPSLVSFSNRKRGLICRGFLGLLLTGFLFLGSCNRNTALERILDSGELTVITRNNAHCYYMYRDEEMGFEYDLAKAFADFLGVRLVVKIYDSWEQLLPSLEEGVGDFVAAGMTITPSRQELADFSKGYLPVQQMVITNKDNKGIRRLKDLNGKTVHVRQGTSYEERLKALQRQGLQIDLKTRNDVPTEELIDEVAHGKSEVTVADSNVALLNRRYYPDVRIAFPIEQPQSFGWAVRQGESDLLAKINAFFAAINEDGTFEEIYKRYYAYVDQFDHMDLKKFQQRIETRLPRYETTIRKAAELHGFDWRLIAAVIYQESQFRPWARSFSGVRGLMQLTLPTAKDMGVKNRLDPHESIVGGVKYLKFLHDLFSDAEEPDRTLITLAAYNVGRGHVLDARILAREMGLNPNKWSSLEKALPLLRQSKYFKKSRYGYCRGTEPVFHVQSILTYYDILKRQAIEYAGAA